MRTDRRTDRHEKISSRFSQYFESSSKRQPLRLFAKQHISSRRIYTATS
jgi:hypothetical protein